MPKGFLFLMAGLTTSTALNSQVSVSAYRALGQRDLQRNGLNMVEGLELQAPAGIALDSRAGQVRVYVSDTSNHRVLAWQDARSYQNGDPPAIVLGQPSRTQSTALGIGAKGFN